jgi:hypothetical protein
MGRIVIAFVFISLVIGVASAQTKTMRGTVVDRQVGNSGKWAGVVIKVGNKKYFVYTEAMHLHNPITVGRIEEVGRQVQVFYTKIVNAPGYDGELRATKIIEIKQSKSLLRKSSNWGIVRNPFGAAANARTRWLLRE